MDNDDIIKEIHKDVVEIKVQIGRLQQQQQTHQIEHDRLWETVSKNSTKIAELELELAKLKTRVAIFFSVLTIVAPLMTTAVIKLFM